MESFNDRESKFSNLTSNLFSVFVNPVDFPEYMIFLIARFSSMVLPLFKIFKVFILSLLKCIRFKGLKSFCVSGQSSNYPRPFRGCEIERTLSDVTDSKGIAPGTGPMIVTPRHRSMTTIEAGASSWPLFHLSSKFSYGQYPIVGNFLSSPYRINQRIRRKKPSSHSVAIQADSRAFQMSDLTDYNF